jgi:hypothetical protein
MMMRRFGEVQFKTGVNNQRSFSGAGRNDGLGWLGA